MANTELTLEQQVAQQIAAAEQRSEPQADPEIRVYQTKTSRKLASGEIKEYTLKHHYVVKKKSGPSATSLKIQAASLRAKIAKKIMPFSLGALHKISEYCEMTAHMEEPRPVVVDGRIYDVAHSSCRCYPDKGSYERSGHN